MGSQHRSDGIYYQAEQILEEEEGGTGEMRVFTLLPCK